MHKEDRTNPYLTNQVRRSGSPRPKNARARLEQEKREAIKASAQASKQPNTPSRETKLDQVRASIAKYSGRKPSSSVNRPVTRSQTKKLFTRLIKSKVKSLQSRNKCNIS